MRKFLIKITGNIYFKLLNTTLPEDKKEHLEWLKNGRDILEYALKNTLVRFKFDKDKRCWKKILGAIDKSIADYD